MGFTASNQLVSGRLVAPPTIFAVASGAGRAAIAIVRLSGSAVPDLLRSLLAGALPEPRRAALRPLLDPRTGERLDSALVLWMPAPSSFTGEDQAELHIHGGVAVRSAILRALSRHPGCRAAEPGEFTRRAFLNGRLDLTAVEGLADLIDAETESQRRQALRQLDGHLAGRVVSWRERLVDALALCEAVLDFSDEDDVGQDAARPALSAAASVRAELAAALSGASRGERVREGFAVVIAGPPNAGKSTLLNVLARRDVAIVSPVPGTTRDAIEVRLDLDGLPITLVDTAGLHESDDAVEQEGMRRATRRMASADLILWLTPAGGTEVPIAQGAPGVPVLSVTTKADLASDTGGPDTDSLLISAETGVGLDGLLAAIGGAATAALEGGDGDAVLTRERHRVALQDALACLDRAGIADHADATELVAEDLRLALRALGRMTGEVDVEEVLDRIFSTFCIGK